MKIPTGHKCLECGKNTSEVNFMIVKQETKEYVSKRCNKCLYKKKVLVEQERVKEDRINRIKLIRKKIKRYFENYNT